MCSSKDRIYCGVVWILCLCLSFTVARQVLDFMGHMWLSIIINFFHIIMLIFSLFGAVQFRPSFLGAFLLWCCIWIAWNVFIACFYLSVGSLSAENVPKILGFGTEGSKSFWIEHTPLCSVEYNLALNIWQEQDCYFSYRYVEVIIAVCHGFLGFLAFCFIIALLTKLKTSRSPRNYRSTPRNRQPRITMEFADPEEENQGHLNGKISYDPAPNGYQSDAYDASSGYLNTSFEPGSPSPSVLKQNGFVPALDKNGLLIQKYKQAEGGNRRSSKKRKKRAQEQQEIIRSARNASPTDDDPTLDSIPAPNVRYSNHREEQFSQATTVEILDEELAARRRARSHSSARQKRETKEQRRNRRTRSVSPLTRQKRAMHHNSTTTLESRVSPDSGMPATIDSERIYRNRSNSKSRAHKHYAAPGHLHHRHGGSQDSTLVAARLAREYHDPDCDLQQRFIAEPRRLSVTEPRGIRNSNDSVLNGKSYQKTRESSNSNLHQQSPERALINPPLTSLVSFDPKSNTLIRYHDHLARSQEAVNPHDTTQGTDDTEPLPPLPTDIQLKQHGAITPNHYSSNSSDRNQHYPHSQGKLINAPSSDRVSYDSGHPPSSIIYNNEWSSQGSSGSSELYGHGQKALLPPRKPVGYEPSVADVDPAAFRNPPVTRLNNKNFQNGIHGEQSRLPQLNNYGYSTRSQQADYSKGPSSSTDSERTVPPYRNPFPNISYQPSYQERMAAMDNSDECDIQKLPPPPLLPSNGPRLAPVRDGVLMAYDNDDDLPPPEPIIKTIPISSRGQFLPSLTTQLSVERLNDPPESKSRSSHSDYGYSAARMDDDFSRNSESVDSGGLTEAPLINNSLLV